MLRLAPSQRTRPGSAGDLVGRVGAWSATVRGAWQETETESAERDAGRSADGWTSSRDGAPLGAVPSRPLRAGDPAELTVAVEGFRGGGRSLDAAETASMGAWFGHDFARVRVHSGESAAGAADRLHARAYTVGSVVAFGRGEYLHGSLKGRRLLVHELVHVLQQALPGSARSMQKAPKKKAAPAIEAPNLAIGGGEADPAQEDLIADIVLAMRLDLGSPGPLSLLRLRHTWASASTLIQEPKADRKPNRTEPYPELLDPAIVTRLSALGVQQRQAVASEVERRLVTSYQSQSIEDLSTEYAALSDRVHALMDGRFLTWVAMRDGLLRCFSDIPSLNAYFATLVPAGFPVPGIGGGALVHPVLKGNLDRARKVIHHGWMPRVMAALGHEGIGATNIRENTARPADIGTHAFGWAMDIAPTHNPDVRPFPEIFTEVTSVDAGAGSDVDALRGSGLATNDALVHAQALRRSSDEIVAAFADEASIKKAITGYLARHSTGTLSVAQQGELEALLKDAVTAKGRAQGEAVNRVTRWMLDRQDAVRARATPPEDRMSRPAEATPWVMAMQSRLVVAIHSPQELAAPPLLIEQQIATPVTRQPKEATGLGLAPLYSQASVKDLRAMDAATKQHSLSGIRKHLSVVMENQVAADTTARIRELHQVFLDAKRARARDPAIKPEKGSATGQIAAHGWMSHAPELVAALVGGEGANLTWLGVMLQTDHGKTVGSKDTMHFEFRPADYPALPGGRYPDVIRGGPAPVDLPRAISPLPTRRTPHENGRSPTPIPRTSRDRSEAQTNAAPPSRGPPRRRRTDSFRNHDLLLRRTAMTDYVWIVR